MKLWVTLCGFIAAVASLVLDVVQFWRLVSYYLYLSMYMCAS